MFEWIKRWLHPHQWKTIETHQVVRYQGNRELIRGIEHLQQCEVCGKLKVFKQEL
jgi:hypothetical protein